jgi:hypothetical protein
MSEIVFTARLTEDDWDEAMRGWRCQVLLVPGAIVEAIYVEGDRIDSARYEVLTQHAFIRWIAPNKPQRVAAFIKLTETLSLDKETERWKRLAIILPVVATVIAASISGAATYFSRSPAVRSSAASAPMQALSSAMGAAGSSSSSLQDFLARHRGLLWRVHRYRTLSRTRTLTSPKLSGSSLVAHIYRAFAKMTRHSISLLRRGQTLMTCRFGWS